jgi:hypothetical protein
MGLISKEWNLCGLSERYCPAGACASTSASGGRRFGGLPLAAFVIAARVFDTRAYGRWQRGGHAWACECCGPTATELPGACGCGRLGPLVDWRPDEYGYRLLSVRRNGVLALWNFAMRRSTAWQINGLC